MRHLCLIVVVVAACRGDQEAARPASRSPEPIPETSSDSPSEGDVVTVRGTVLEASMNAPVADLEVVFRGVASEVIAKTAADGTYHALLRPGRYRAVVRGPAVMSVGRMDRVRLPGLPGPEAAHAPDEALMPLVVIAHDAEGVDLSVVRAGVVTGSVVDVDGRAISGAVISAHGSGARPALGTDVAQSRSDGTFELALPDGDYQLAASHARFADSTNIARIEIRNGGTRHVSLTLLAGCVITGRVVDARGQPTGEGAIERRFGGTDLEFAPSGRIDSDGSFRWTTTEEVEITLRAWPWHAPPSAPHRFACREGGRFTATFALPAREPDLAGLLVDREGRPVPFTHLDVQPLDPGGIAQQERTDAEGRWAVFQLPAGRYAVTGHAPGGVVSTSVSSPQRDVRLTLSGTRRIAGTTTTLANGSFDLALGACLDGATFQLPHDQRLVTVTNNQFTIDDVPACDLQLVAAWHGESQTARAAVPGTGVARIQLDLGPPRDKTVHGIVRDRRGDRVSHARVTATYRKRTTSVITDDDGGYSIGTFAGALLTVERDRSRGRAGVGLANVDDERVDIVLGSVDRDP